jgi:hypothetical protein
MASIDHSMWFHHAFRADEWLLYDMDSPAASQGRGLAFGRFYTREGKLVVSTAQEGLIRLRSISADKAAAEAKKRRLAIAKAAAAAAAASDAEEEASRRAKLEHEPASLSAGSGGPPSSKKSADAQVQASGDDVVQKQLQQLQQLHSKL